MAAREEGEGQQRDFIFGHALEYNVRFQDLDSRWPFSFERSFTFDCSEAPTSWTFTLNFERSLGSVTCQIVLRRTDNWPGKVDFRFNLRPFSDPLHDHPAILVERQSFELGFESRTNFTPLLPLEAVRLAPQDGVLVNIHFYVQGCHPKEMPLDWKPLEFQMAKEGAAKR